MTQRDSSAIEMAPKALVPAWLFSALFHFSLIVILGLAIQPSPRGAAEEPRRSAGIVLKTTSAAGDLYEGEEEAGDSTSAEQGAD